MEITVEFDTIGIIDQLIDNLVELENIAKNGVKKVDLYVKRFVTPMSLLPLCVYANAKGIEIDHSMCGDDVSGYLNFMCFPEGTQEIPDAGKSYLKISRVSCDKDHDFISKYEKVIINEVSSEFDRDSFEQSLNILTGELIGNVKDHAQISEYWIFAQYWPVTKTCEIAIADAGIGMKKSYEGSRFAASTDIEAIWNAVGGQSSKSVKNGDRGYGIPTTIGIFCEGYGGEIIIMSGQSLLHLHHKPTEHDIQCDWQGSFIGIKFKLRDLNPYSVIAAMHETSH